MAESTFPEDCGPSLNSLCSLAEAVTPEGPPDEGKRIRIEFVPPQLKMEEAFIR
jgi:hypothetical protein